MEKQCAEMMEFKTEANELKQVLTQKDEKFKILNEENQKLLAKNSKMKHKIKKLTDEQTKLKDTHFMDSPSSASGESYSPLPNFNDLTPTKKDDFKRDRRLSVMTKALGTKEEEITQLQINHLLETSHLKNNYEDLLKVFFVHF